jgi:peptidoglycan/xylan/chitin deacetylase (PgdA/CDA1 family)
MSARWSCLMYHEVPSGNSPVGYFSVPRRRFEEQLDGLLAVGLAPSSLEQGLECTAAPPMVALTFDDGHRTHYEEAFPALASRCLTATFFVTTSWIGTPGYVTWDQLREMSDAGMSIQSHTVTHPFLSELDAREVERELADSKAMIEDKLARPCVTLALPGGDAPRAWRVEHYARLGFRFLATSRWGPNRVVGARSSSEVIVVRRYTVRRDTPMDVMESLARAATPRYSREGIRLAVLHAVRSALGTSRYSRWRRRVLRTLGSER